MTLDRLKVVASALAKEFHVRYKDVEELSREAEHFGECVIEDRVIRVRLKVHNRNTEMKRSTVVRTLCHEMAHLIETHHTRKFKKIERLMLQLAKHYGVLDN
jgi:predicted metal-dependent hydrolase